MKRCSNFLVVAIFQDPFIFIWVGINSFLVLLDWLCKVAAANHILRAACLQNETAPEKLLNRYEKRFEKREKGSEKRSKRV